MLIQKSDLIRELEDEKERCLHYTSYMYQVLQFTFVAIIALTVCGFSNEVDSDGFKVIFRLVLPICFYIFGIMYAFNAYALVNCGKREELLHAALFNTMEKEDGQEMIFLDRDASSLIIKKVVADRWISMISYGVPLGFYLVLPVASIRMGYVMHGASTKLPYFIITVLPNCGILVYYILMFIIISRIFKGHFIIKNIQEKVKSKVENITSI